VLSAVLLQLAQNAILENISMEIHAKVRWI